MYTNGSFNPSPGNGPPNQMHLPHLQQNHASHPPPPPPQVQQDYMYLPPPPTSSSQFHSHLPPVSSLPPPPPSPTGTMPPAQSFPNPFHPLPSFPLSFPLKSLEPRGMPLPPPPPRSSSPLFADTDCDAKHVCESVSLYGRAVDLEGPVVEDAGSSKESSIRCDESSSPREKAEHDSPLYSDPDIEMEDDITLPENENYPSQLLNCGSDQVPGAYFNTEQPPPQRITGTAMNVQTKLPVPKSYAQIHQDVDDGSRQASSSPYSVKAKIVSKCGLGDMYDPFVDSFEPASVSVQEQEPVLDSYTAPQPSISSNRPLNMEENNQGVDKQATSESDMTAGVSVSSNKPPDVEENTTGNDIGAVISVDNDEYGENAENEREGNSHETGTPKANNNVRDCEGDSIRKKSQGDPKEKDSSSRSMKLFKVALTKFVKDLLKPSWRQGNMSKEAFKTIVKRAVDKVSNSMEGRRVPKSRAKIDKYIDTSQHKLTKLVMGYVDKYVKA